MAIKCPKCRTENPDTQRFCGDCGTSLAPAGDSPAVTKTMEVPKEELATGATFAGRYQIIEELGKGGMGKVYRVLDKTLKEEVALKLIRPEIALDRTTLERFQNELKTARKIGHRYVGRMYELLEDRGTHYITMEYVRGEDLKSFIRRSGQMAVGTMLRITKQVCEGLAEAHRLGVVHRDLKPSNIMIDNEGNSRIMDFGIARSVGGKGITGAGVMIGTPEYMSPEQVESKEIDQRSDIYSLGVILYEMVAGRVPFEGDTPISIGVKHKSESPRPPIEINTGIPEDLNRLILKCLEKDKEKRYQSAGEVSNELNKIEGGIPTTKRIIPEKKPFTSKEITVTFGLKKTLVLAAVLIGVVIIGTIIWKLIPKKAALSAPKIANSVAVISFENQTGDSAFDYLQKAIPNLLITNLENTGYLHVATWERLDDLLKQMGNADMELIDKDTGFELCRREGIESIVLGSYVKAGNTFATDVKVLDTSSKKLLKSASSRGEGIDSILRTQIDELSREISLGIGIARQKIEATKLNVSEATTASMEAYDAYLQGKEAYEKFYFDDARQDFEEAVAIDPEFAVAHLFLGRSQGELQNRSARDEHYKKAMDLSAKTTEKERLFIEACYAGIIEQDAEKKTRILKELVAKYPREKDFYYELGVVLHSRGFNDQALEVYEKALQLDPDYAEVCNDLAYVYMDKNEYEKAIAYFEKYASLNPNDANPHDSMGELLFRMGRLDEAIGKYKYALSLKPDFLESAFSLSYIYALKEDYVSTLVWIDRMVDKAPSPGLKSGACLWKGTYLYLLGRQEEAFSQFTAGETYAEEAKNPFREFMIAYSRGWVYYDLKRFDSSRQHFQVGLDIFAKLYPESSIGKFVSSYILGLLDVEEGKIVPAQKELENLRKFYLELSDSLKRETSNYEDWLYGKILLAQGSFEKAAPLLRHIFPEQMRNLRVTDMGPYNFPFQVDESAQLYAQNREWDKAIEEYKRLMTVSPGSESRRLINPKYHYRIAKLYEQKGWKDQAIAHYEKFLDFWKEADPKQMEIVDAKKRLANLRV
ncbi:MAG: protein kinase [Candidatus Aminicenantes bacterium]|nr:protein kinase [Candidatus Aminicenantes bacterium]